MFIWAIGPRGAAALDIEALGRLGEAAGAEVRIFEREVRAGSRELGEIRASGGAARLVLGEANDVPPGMRFRSLFVKPDGTVVRDVFKVPKNDLPAKDVHVYNADSDSAEFPHGVKIEQGDATGVLSSDRYSVKRIGHRVIRVHAGHHGARDYDIHDGTIHGFKGAVAQTGDRAQIIDAQVNGRFVGLISYDPDADKFYAIMLKLEEDDKDRFMEDYRKVRELSPAEVEAAGYPAEQKILPAKTKLDGKSRGLELFDGPTAPAPAPAPAPGSDPGADPEASH